MILQELYIWIGILIYMGIYPENIIEMYWSYQNGMPRHKLVFGAIGYN
jgi:hypothetical protein